MKNLFKNLMMTAFALCAFASCESESNTDTVFYDVVTFEDAAGQDYWASKIDTAQYGGGLLYGEWNPTGGSYSNGGYNGTNYSWSDNNTGLSSAYSSSTSTFWGAIAISDYSLLLADTAGISNSLYLYQLSVPYGSTSNGAGYAGSDKFAVVYDSYASMNFGTDSVTIAKMYVSPTTYSYCSMTGGDGYATALTKQGDYFKVTATGYSLDYTETGSSDFYFAQNGVFVSKWTAWDLSALGEVNSVVFTFEGSDMSVDMGSGSWLNTAAYFAFDNVTILKK